MIGKITHAATQAVVLALKPLPTQHAARPPIGEYDLGMTDFTNKPATARVLDSVLGAYPEALHEPPTVVTGDAQQYLSQLPRR